MRIYTKRGNVFSDTARRRTTDVRCSFTRSRRLWTNRAPINNELNKYFSVRGEGGRVCKLVGRHGGERTNEFARINYQLSRKTRRAAKRDHRAIPSSLERNLGHINPNYYYYLSWLTVFWNVV